MSYNTYLNVIILLCTLCVSLLSFSKEIDEKLGTPFLNRLSLKIPVIIICILIGGWANYEKEKEGIISNKIKDFRIGVLNSHIQNSVDGAGFPSIYGTIENHHLITLTIINMHWLPIYSINVNYTNYYAFDLELKKAKRTGLDINSISTDSYQKNVSVPSLPPNEIFIFYQKQINFNPNTDFRMKVYVFWRNNSYICDVSFKYSESNSIECQLSYEFKGKKYTREQFEKFLNPKN